MSLESPSRILVFQTAFLGDVFLSIPLLLTLKKNFSNAKLGLVCRKGLGEFFLVNKIVDQVFEVDKKNSESLRAAFRSTQEFNPDVIVSPHKSLRTALWVRRLNAKTRVGFSSLLTNWAYTRRVHRDKTKHDVLRQLSLIEPLEIAFPPEDILYRKMTVTPWEKYPQLKNFIALAPGSQWETKRWSLQGYVQCAKKFVDEGKQVVIVGGVDELSLGQELQRQVPKVTNLIGQTSILELARLLSQAKLLITNDNGAMHVATVVGVPVVSIFGPTVKEQGYAPWSKKAKVVEHAMGCRPCGAHGHHKCPLGTHDCMLKITAEKVLQSAQSWS